MDLGKMLRGYVDIRQTNKSKQDLNTAKKQVQDVANTSQAASKTMKGFRGQIMGVGFAALFGGMALYRVFGGALRSLFSNYKEVMDETSEFNQKTNQLSGAWTFFKFTLIDALMQTGLFQTIVGFLVQLINGVARFTSKHPQLTSMIVVFLGIVAVISLLAMIIGQPILMLSFLGTSVKTASITFLTWFGRIIGIVAILAATIIILNNIWNGSMPTWAKWLATIGTLIVAVGLSFTLFGKAGLLALKTVGKAVFTFMMSPLGIAIMAIIGGFIIMTNHLGSVGNAFKAFGIFLLAIFAFIGDAIVESLLLPLRAVIALLNSVIRASNKFLGTNFKTIKQPEFMSMSKKVWEMRNKLLEQSMAEKEASGQTNVGSLFKNPLSNISSTGLDNMADNLSGQTFDYTSPELIDNSKYQTELDKQQLEAQNIQNEYAAETANNSAETVNILGNMDKNLSSALDFRTRAEEGFGIKSSTTQ